MSQTGDKPGKGSYNCIKCGQKVILKDDEEELPYCPLCNATKYNP